MMAYIRRLPSKLYQATVRLPNGKKVTRTDPLRRVVDDWAKAEEVRIARGEWTDARAGRTTYDEWRDRWTAARVVADATRRREASLLANHLDPQWGGWQLARIKRLDVQAWVRRMEADGVGTPTVHKAYQTLAKMLGDATLETPPLIATSPCRKIDLPAMPPGPVVWFTREQVDAIVRALAVDGLPDARRPGGRTTYPRHAAAVELMACCGLRWGECAGLRIGDVAFLRRRIHVIGMTDQAGRWKEHPKTSKSRREIPVPAHVLELLSPLAAGRPKSELLFTTERGSRPWSGSNWRGLWDRAVDQAGAPAYSPHALRHTAASWLVQAGVPLYDVQRLLGHESFSTTQRYAHLAPDAHAAVEGAWEKLVAHQRRTATAAGAADQE